MRLQRLHGLLAQFTDRYRSLGQLRDSRLALLAGANLLDSASTSLIVPLLPLYAAEATASPTFLGLLFALPPLFHAMFSTPMGYLADRLGRKPFMITGMGISGLAVVGLATTLDPATLLALRAVDGLGSAMRSAPTTAYVGDVADGDERAQALGAYRSAGMLAMAVGPVVGGGLATVGPLALPFQVLGAGTVLGAVALLWLPPAPRGVDAELSLPTPGALRRTITPAIAVVGLSGFLAALGTAALNPVFAPLLRTTVDASPGYVGLAWGLLGLGVAVFVPVGGTLADESGRVRTLVAGKGLWALVMVGLAVATLPIVPLALVFLGGIASGLMGPAQGVLRYEIAPEGRESTLVGAFGALGAAGAVVGPVAGGWAADAVGVRTTAVIVGVVWVIDGLALHLGVSEPAR